MPDQRYDVSAKTAWNRNSPGSKREDGDERKGEREGKSALSLGVGSKTSVGIAELSLSWFPTIPPSAPSPSASAYRDIHAREYIYEFYVMHRVYTARPADARGVSTDL